MLLRMTKPLEKIDFEKVLRKKFAHQDNEHDSMLSVTREVPPELAPPVLLLPNKLFLSPPSVWILISLSVQ
eukprot:UN13724